MTADATRLDFEISGLAEQLDRLGPRGKATIFGICGRALAPILAWVEQKTEGRYTAPDIVPTLDLIEAFATGVAQAEDHSKRRAVLMDAAPHGDNIDAPWSTYAQDVLICVDAGLAAASVEANIKSNWIEYSLEPLLVSMQIRDVDMIRLCGENHWRGRVVEDPALISALRYLKYLIERVQMQKSVDSSEFAGMVREAAVLRPIDL